MYVLSKASYLAVLWTAAAADIVASVQRVYGALETISLKKIENGRWQLPVDVIDHNTSWFRVGNTDQHTMTCAVCRQFSQHSFRIIFISVVEFLTSNVNR